MDQGTVDNNLVPARLADPKTPTSQLLHTTNFLITRLLSKNPGVHSNLLHLFWAKVFSLLIQLMSRI